LNKD